MDQLDSPDGARGVLELLESQHRPEARLDVAVILLNDIVEILTRADRDGPQLSILGPKLANGPMGGLVSVESDRPGHASLSLEGLTEKGFGGGHIALGAQAKVDRLTAGIHGAIEVHPAATNLDVRLIHAPRAADRACEAIPALLELRRLMLHPAQDGARCEGDTAFGHHRDEVSVREFVWRYQRTHKMMISASNWRALEDLLDAP